VINATNAMQGRAHAMQRMSRMQCTKQKLLTQKNHSTNTTEEADANDATARMQECKQCLVFCTVELHPKHSLHCVMYVVLHLLHLLHCVC